MPCQTCGFQPGHPGQAHSCPSQARADAAPVPAGWHVATWSLVALALAFGLTSVLNAGLILLIHLTVGASQLPVSILNGVEPLSMLFLVTLVAHLAAFSVWSRASKRLVERHGGDLLQVRSRALTFWSATFLGSVILTLATIGVGNPAILLVLLFARLGLRTLSAVLLIVGALVTRARILRLVAGPPIPAGSVPTMACQHCGFQPAYPGQAHGCRPGSPVHLSSVPPAGWHAATWLLVGLGALFGLGWLLEALRFVLFFVDRLKGAVWLPLSFPTFIVMILVALLAILVASAIWTRSSQRLVERHGGDLLPLRSKVLTLWWCALGGAAVLTLLGFYVIDLAVPERIMLTLVIVRLALLLLSPVFLIVGVLLTRARILRFLAGPPARSESA
ncbi:MAG TPA: hypothetical protein VF755_25150 [Catenuloplanes sp.]